MYSIFPSVRNFSTLRLCKVIFTWSVFFFIIIIYFCCCCCCPAQDSAGRTTSRTQLFSLDGSRPALDLIPAFLMLTDFTMLVGIIHWLEYHLVTFLIQSLRLWPLMRWIETGSKAFLAIKNLAFQNENSLRRQFTLVHTAGKLGYLSCACEVFSWLPMLFYILLPMQPRQRGIINVNIQDK